MCVVICFFIIRLGSRWCCCLMSLFLLVGLWCRYIVSCRAVWWCGVVSFHFVVPVRRTCFVHVLVVWESRACHQNRTTNDHQNSEHKPQHTEHKQTTSHLITSHHITSRATQTTNHPETQDAHINTQRTSRTQKSRQTETDTSVNTSSNTSTWQTKEWTQGTTTNGRGTMVGGKKQHITHSTSPTPHLVCFTMCNACMFRWWCVLCVVCCAFCFL